MPHHQSAGINSDASRPEPMAASSGQTGRHEPSGGAPTGKESHGKAPWLPIPRWLFNMIGHAIAAVLGLALGYLILHALRPDSFPAIW